MVRVTPGARATMISGVVRDSDGRLLLAVRLAAKPVEDAANRALIDALAKLLQVPRSTVSLVSGETARTKRVRIAGNLDAVVQRLQQAIRPA